jgi:hypothetical protein
MQILGDVIQIDHCRRWMAPEMLNLALLMFSRRVLTDK